MVELSLYSPTHGIRARARVPNGTMTLRSKQVKRLESDLREPLYLCQIRDLDGRKFIPIRLDDGSVKLESVHVG